MRPKKEENKTPSQSTKLKAIYTPLGASNHSTSQRAEHDYYATDPRAAELLLEVEDLAPVIWEPACGEGHMSKVFETAGHTVRSTDLVYRGYGNPESLDFLTYNGEPFDGDIVTNPPYSAGAEFVRKAIDTVTEGHKVCMFLKLQFLEGQKRRKLFEQYPPRTVYVLSSRLKCAKNGLFDSIGASAVAYAWYVWEKDFHDASQIRWIN